MWKWIGGVLAVVVLAVGAWAVLVWPDRATTNATPANAQESPAPSKVLMIPGYGGGQSQLRSLGSKLSSAGIQWAIIDVGDGQGDLKKYAREVSNEAAELKEAGYAVDLIGYSAGGITARIAATDHPDDFRRVVTLSAPHQGTTLADMGAAIGECPKACQQMRPGSTLLNELASQNGQDQGPDADWLSVYSSTDEVIRPAGSSELDGAEVEQIQEACDGVTIAHGEVPTYRQTVAMVVAFLEEQPLPSRCVS